ncbi:MAG: D-alanyl-D-alanine carboxypeptidase/D-alanyl-D-alanine-endopeptidase [Bifidobacterium sp.]|nr:D-alanyl-D-alanine carboxypeptidase/D-alanyl-D-alanine-endopeptidase [Bifidobacterium sp.]MCI1864662.1 D-alanyl-D-alanine carboxypeptidase/D-alanyl-D-alanine-endopeptidase [Bifidobacterium sp.]
MTTVLFVSAYAWADIMDVTPGVLTDSAVVHPTYAQPKTAIPAGVLAGKANEDIPISTSKANALIAQFEANDAVGTDFSIAIANAQGRIVAGHDPRHAREPASTLKTLTVLAAASTLDMGGTLDTQVYLNQPRGGTATLVLKGNGDMLLGSFHSDASHINGHAGLGTLAQQTAGALRERGITSVKLHYDDSLFGSQRYPSNIATNNPQNRYYTGISSMAVDGGRQWGSGSRPADPDTFDDYPQLSTQPAGDAARVFAQRLREQGITVQGDVQEGTVPAGLSPITHVSSAPLSQVMAFLLRHSDNTLAEEFGRLTALKKGDDNSPQGAVSAVTSTLSALGIDTDGLTMADCCGLSPGSTVSVATLAAVQARNLRPDGAAAAAEGLSVPGLVGTALNRLADPQAAGLLRVKTGSLDSVTSMAGNVSRTNSSVLAFAVIVNNPQDYEKTRTAIDTFVSGLAGL